MRPPAHWLLPGSDFPPVDTANAEGVVAVGGDYGWRRLLRAYVRGIFPWSNPDDPPIWWSPDPRYVILPDDVRVRRSMRPYVNQRRFRVTYDTHFAEVMEACRTSPRQGEAVGSWITDELTAGFRELHARGYAHSVEAWTAAGELAGGLYGVGVGRVFCGESMFTRVSNASKYAFLHLARNLRRRGYWLIDCQLPTAHLASLGAVAVSRREFTRAMALNTREPTDRGPWTNLMTDDALDDRVEG